jgi:hypothetical protein
MEAGRRFEYILRWRKVPLQEKLACRLAAEIARRQGTPGVGAGCHRKFRLSLCQTCRLFHLKKLSA